MSTTHFDTKNPPLAWLIFGLILVPVGLTHLRGVRVWWSESRSRR